MDRLTAQDLDRIISEADLLGPVTQAIAHALRTRYGDKWLIHFTMPGEMDAADFENLAQAMIESLRSQIGRRVESEEELRPAVIKWLSRFADSRREQWTRLGKETEDVATALSGRDDLTQHADMFLSGARRDAVIRAVQDEIPDHLGQAKAIATRDEIAQLAAVLVKEHLGAGALEEYLTDPDLSEIMVGNRGQIWIERNGAIEETGKTVSEERALWLGQRIATMIGSRLDGTQPSLDGYLPDGSRVHVLIPPVAMDGTSISIRRHTKRPTIEQLLSWGAVSPEAVEFLRSAVQGRANLIVSGGTSSGKTSLLNALATFIPAQDRIITIEDTPELHLELPHVIRLRTRRQNIEGKNEVSMQQLVRESLRMRPDRIWVGEVRGAEALDMIESQNTGHDGGGSTLHANSARDALKRIGQMLKRGDSTLTDSGAYELIASAIHLIIHAERRVIGGRVSRGVEEIVEIVDYHTDRPGLNGFELNPIFIRDEDRNLVQVGEPSARLAQHLALNGATWTGKGVACV